MLYYLGYLTIDPVLSNSDGLMLKIPNLFMSKLFAQCTVDLRLKPNSIFREQKLVLCNTRCFAFMTVYKGTLRAP